MSTIGTSEQHKIHSYLCAPKTRSSLPRVERPSRSIESPMAMQSLSVSIMAVTLTAVLGSPQEIEHPSAMRTVNQPPPLAARWRLFESCNSAR
jgi:hypothetical protein